MTALGPRHGRHDDGGEVPPCGYATLVNRGAVAGARVCSFAARRTGEG